MSSAEAIILTRPEGMNEAFAKELNALNLAIDIHILPLAHHVALGDDITDLAKYDGLIVTSQTAARFLNPAQISNMPAYVVGAETAKAMEAMGAKVRICEINAQTLANRLSALSSIQLAYLSAKRVSFDFVSAGLDIQIDQFPIYETKALAPSSMDFRHFEKYNRLIFPVFSQGSFERLMQVIEGFKANRQLEFVPISPKLGESILDSFNNKYRDMGYIIKSALVHDAPDSPCRSDFIKKMQSIVE